MKSVLITGVSSGIGQSTAKLFAKRGWTVYGTVRSARPDEGRIHYICLDVTKPETITVPDVDVIVNNAGYGLFGAVECCTELEVYDQYNTNVFGVLRMIRAVLPAMRRKNQGVIINVTSIVGKVTLPYMGVYCSTKYAVESLSEALWHELYKTNIRVKIIEPGRINTNFSGRSKRRGSTIIPLYETEIKKILKESGGGSKPSVIAQLIYSAATDSSRKLRYCGGQMAKPTSLVRKLLPDWVFMRLVRLYR